MKRALALLALLAFLPAAGAATFTVTAAQDELYRVGVGHRLCFDAPVTDAALVGPTTTQALALDSSTCASFRFKETGPHTLSYNDGAAKTADLEAWQAAWVAIAWAVAWIVALMWCLANAKLLAAAMATMGTATGFLPDIAPWVSPFVLVAFVLSLWLEALAKDRIYSRFLTNDKRRPTKE